MTKKEQREEVLTTLRTIIHGTANVPMDVLKNDALFMELGIDSLDGVDITEQLIDFYGTPITTEEYYKFRDMTIGDVVNHICEKLNND